MPLHLLPDVGGGSVANDTAHTLARIPLRWMIRECFKTDTGIRFHAELLRRIGLDPFSLHPTVRDRPPPMVPEPAHVDSVALPVSQHTEEDHEVRDAISPIYDQLEIAWMSWWPLELLPTTKKNKTDWCVGFRALCFLSRLYLTVLTRGWRDPGLTWARGGMCPSVTSRSMFIGASSCGWRRRIWRAVLTRQRRPSSMNLSGSTEHLPPRPHLACQ